MTIHALSEHFDAFFARLNPGPSFQQRASSQHNAITALIQDPHGPASALSPICFLQGSYRRQTAIYTINDIDVVVLCRAVADPPSLFNWGPPRWDRDTIFDAIATSLRQDPHYRDKVRYRSTSMCIKVDLGIKVEILPVVLKRGTNDPAAEPFRLYRPERRRWEDGFARRHQDLLSRKNKDTGGRFIPAVKVFKHLRSRYKLRTVSFHIECLLYRLPDRVFRGSPPDYIAAILSHLSAYSTGWWYRRPLRTPCGDRAIFTTAEWQRDDWDAFHGRMSLCARHAAIALDEPDRGEAIADWQRILGDDFFPLQVGR